MTLAVHPASTGAFDQIDEATYRRRQRAWMLYDWANSAFATTILAAVLPAYYSGVAGATLPSEATATGRLEPDALHRAVHPSPLFRPFSAQFRTCAARQESVSFAVRDHRRDSAPGCWSSSGPATGCCLDPVHHRARRLSASIVFYDALLPHVARPNDVDRLSTVGYAIGYLGGGLLLAANIVMIFVFGSELGRAAVVPQRGDLVGGLLDPGAARRAGAASRDRRAWPR